MPYCFIDKFIKQEEIFIFNIFFFRLTEHGEFGQAGTSVTTPTPIVGSNPLAIIASAGNESVTALHLLTAVQAATVATWRLPIAPNTVSGPPGPSGARAPKRVTSE